MQYYRDSIPKAERFPVCGMNWIAVEAVERWAHPRFKNLSRSHLTHNEESKKAKLSPEHSKITVKIKTKIEISQVRTPRQSQNYSAWFPHVIKSRSYCSCQLLSLNLRLTINIVKNLTGWKHQSLYNSVKGWHDKGNICRGFCTFVEIKVCLLFSVLEFWRVREVSSVADCCMNVW